MEEGGAEKAAEEEKGEKEKSGKTKICSRKILCFFDVNSYADPVEEPVLSITVREF
jgi:hypothetical protein